MVAYFKRECYLFSGLGAGVGLLTAIALYPGVFSTQPEFIRMFYPAMLVIIGLISGRLYATLWANKRLSVINRILYQQGQPQEFIDRFQPIVQKANPDSAEAMAGYIKLAFAMEALGRFQEAASSLERLDPKRLKLHALTVTASLRNQQLRLALLMNEPEKIDRYLADLRDLQEIAQNRAVTVASQLTQCIRLAECWLCVLRGQDTDESYLSEEIQLATNSIHKSEMQLLLAQAFHNRGDEEASTKMLLAARTCGQGLWTEKRADALIRQQS